MIVSSVPCNYSLVTNTLQGSKCFLQVKLHLIIFIPVPLIHVVQDAPLSIPSCDDQFNCLDFTFLQSSSMFSQHSEFHISPILSFAECANSPCADGADCLRRENDNPTYVCQCNIDGTMGLDCDIPAGKVVCHIKGSYTLLPIVFYFHF